MKVFSRLFSWWRTRRLLFSEGADERRFTGPEVEFAVGVVRGLFKDAEDGFNIIPWLDVLINPIGLTWFFRGVVDRYNREQSVDPPLRPVRVYEAFVEIMKRLDERLRKLDSIPPVVP